MIYKPEYFVFVSLCEPISFLFRVLFPSRDFTFKLYLGPTQINLLKLIF